MRIRDLLNFLNDSRIPVGEFRIGSKTAKAYIGTDESKHKYPHVHIVLSNEDTAFIIQTGEKLVGSLVGAQAIQARNWVLGHRHKLSRYWNKYSGGRKIELTRYGKRKKNLRSRKGRMDDWYSFYSLATIIAKNGGLCGARFSEMF